MEIWAIGCFVVVAGIREPPRSPSGTHHFGELHPSFCILPFQWLHLQRSLQDHLELLALLGLLRTGSAALRQ